MSNARTLASTINSSSQIVVPSGGIQFADATNANTVANQSNLIEQDGYEEGTYTATLGYGSTTITSVTGNYTKIGELVRVDFDFANVTAVSGQTPYVSGLPFANANANPTSSLWSKSFFPSADTIHQIAFSGPSSVQFRKDDSFGNATMNGATGTYLVGTLIYRTNS